MVLYVLNLAAGLLEANETPLEVELQVLYNHAGTKASSPTGQLDLQDPKREEYQ